MGSINGESAEHVVARGSSPHRLSDSVSSEAGALAEPLSCCVRAPDQSGFAAGASAVVIGNRPISCPLIWILKISGASWTITAGHHYDYLRRVDALGTVRTINTKHEEVLHIG